MYVTLDDLFVLRAAAAQWLVEHPNDPNAKAVEEALMNSNPPYRS
jgi:hypothetical protein